MSVILDCPVLLPTRTREELLREEGICPPIPARKEDFRREDFVRWLGQFPDDIVVGTRHCPAACPLQHWLTDWYGDYGWRVNFYSASFRVSGGKRLRRTLPGWMWRLVALVDQRGTFREVVTAGEVRARV